MKIQSAYEDFDLEELTSLYKSPLEEVIDGRKVFDIGEVLSQTEVKFSDLDVNITDLMCDLGPEDQAVIIYRVVLLGAEIQASRMHYFTDEGRTFDVYKALDMTIQEKWLIYCARFIDAMAGVREALVEMTFDGE